MNSKLFVYASGLAAIAPAIISAVSTFALDGMLYGQIAVVILIKVIAVVFAVHAFKETRLETSMKLLWSAAMIIVPGFLIPAYWFKHIWPNLAWHNYADLSDSTGVQGA